MEFVKTSEGDGLAVYQAMRRVKGKQKPSGEVVEVLLPDLPEALADTKPIAAALKEFPGRVRAVSWSLDAGLSVRIEVVPPAPCAKCGELLEDRFTFCPACGAERKDG